MTGLVGNVSIPTYDGSTVGWAGEVDAAKDGAGTFGEVELSPKRLTAYVDISKQFLIQDSVSAEALLRKDIVDAISNKLEATILGAEAGSTTKPAGLFNAVVADEADITYKDIVAMEQKLEEANVSGNITFIASPYAKATLKTTAIGGTKSDVRMLMDSGEVDGYPVLVTNGMAKKGLILGNHPPRRLVMPPDPRAHKHPGDQIIERDLLVQIQQVAERPRRRAPAHAGLRLCQHRPQEKIHLPQRQRQKHRLAHKRTRSGHRGQHRRNADEKRRAAAVHAHGPCQRIGREHRACHIYGVQPSDGRDLRGGGFQQQRRQNTERVQNLLVVAGHIAYPQPASLQKAARHIQIPQLVAVDGQLPRVAAQHPVHNGAHRKQHHDPQPAVSFFRKHTRPLFSKKPSPAGEGGAKRRMRAGLPPLPVQGLPPSLCPHQSPAETASPSGGSLFPHFSSI